MSLSSQRGLIELKKLAVKFEGMVFAASTSQSEYLRKISEKLQLVEMKFKKNNSGAAGNISHNSMGQGIMSCHIYSIQQMQMQGAQQLLPQPQPQQQQQQQLIYSNNTNRPMTPQQGQLPPRPRSMQPEYNQRQSHDNLMGCARVKADDEEEEDDDIDDLENEFNCWVIV
ncbi:hypothetical protein COLO4_36143 [Corchorus olitorius]|uniref:Mediator complex subunit 15 KIX domain-containing protein n=1 Tax=Corchorus olitorius TaxID=93759 RepID=A0A1R3GAS9_9ROSI|nr:hypothetical protein COLO4_36143 [Corchorus olitorius]